MKLLQEFLIINEQNEKKVDGWMVTADDIDAERGSVSEELYPGSRYEPPDYSEPVDVYLNIKSFSVIVEKTREEVYYVYYTCNPKANYMDEGKFLKDKFVKDLQTLTPRLYNDEDDEITDTRIVVQIKSIVTKYAEQFDLLGDIYDKATEKQIDARDWYPDDRDGDDRDGDDRDDDIGDHPYY